MGIFSERSDLRLRGGIILPFALFLPAPAAAEAGPAAAPFELSAALATQPGDDLRPFYLARNNQPLWLTSDGKLNEAALAFLHLVETAVHDGIDPSPIRTPELLAAIQMAQQGASGSSLARVELLLSRSFAAYESAMRQAPHGEMVYSPDDLKPVLAAPSIALARAADTPSLLEYVRSMGWMHPLYAQLRAKLTEGGASEHERHVLTANLTRLRAIPGPGTERHVFVNTATSQLFMYENGQVVGSMRVIVGRPDDPTPTMAASIRYAIFKPYWNLPWDYVRDTVARHVIRQGPQYLKIRKYEVLSDWSDNPTIVDPTTIDWPAVASGAVKLRLRQLPRFGNAMGRVKYELPNSLGIYLHDTPEKHLLLKDARHLSMGCIRLEDADRLGRWLFGSSLPPIGAEPEQKVDLPQPVRIYMTYVTAQPSAGKLVLSRDPYGKDAKPASALALQGPVAPAP